MTPKTRILVLCTGNSCRSQMAEGFFRHYAEDSILVESAGSMPGKVNEIAIAVMREVGIDISGHRSKHLDEFKDIFFDFVITVCDNAKEQCPVYLKSARKLHWGFPDPPHGRVVTDEVMREFRKVRDSIQRKIKEELAAGTLGRVLSVG